MFGGLTKAYNHRYKGRRGFVNRAARAYKMGYFRRYRRRQAGNVGRGARGVPRYLSSIGHTVTQVFRLDSITPFMTASKNTDQYEHVVLLPSQIHGMGPWKALYRQYKVLKVKYEFIPCNNNLKEGTASTFRPTLYTSINRTSSSFANDVQKQMSTNSVRYTLAGKYHCRSFTPMSLDQVYDSTVTTGYAPEVQWLSTDNGTAIPHFGLDVLLGNGFGDEAAEAYKYRLVTTVIIQFKNRKPNTDLG